MFHLSFCSNDEGPAWQKTAQPITVHPFTAPVGPAVPISASDIQVVFHHCFGQIDRGANQLVCCSCSLWDEWESCHQLEICDWEWHSCIPWVCHSDGSEPAAGYGSLLEEGPHLALLPISAETASMKSGDFCISWTTPLCLIAQTLTTIDWVRFIQWFLLSRESVEWTITDLKISP